MAYQNTIISKDTSSKVLDETCSQLEKIECGGTQLPREVWKLILAYMSKEGARYRDLLLFASTQKSLSGINQNLKWLSPSFYNFSITCSMRRFLNLDLSHLSSLPPLNMKKALLHPFSLLTIDQKGRHFYRAYTVFHQEKSFTHLYIFNPNDEGFVSIDLMSNNALIDDKGNDSVQKCIPTQDGFVVASPEGFGIWAFQSNTSKPKLIKFVPLEEEGKFEILGHYEEKCFFLVETRSYALKYFDIHNNEITELIFDETEFTERPYYLGNYKNQLYWNNNRIAINEKNEIKKIETPFNKEMIWGRQWKFKDWEINSKTVTYNDQHGYSVTHDLFCINDSYNWMDPNRLLFPDIVYKRENFFFVDDFLVLSYWDGFRIIHLPTKEEYPTQKIWNLLKGKLGNLDFTLYYLKFNPNNEVELFLQVKKLEGYPLGSSVSYSLQSITLPLTVILPDDQRNLNTGQKVIKLTSPKNPANPSEEPKKSGSPPIQRSLMGILKSDTTETMGEPTTNDEPKSLEFLLDPAKTQKNDELYSGNISPVNSKHLEKTKQEKMAPTVHKVILVVGAILLLLTIGACVPLGILHPGKIIFEGSGIILTLPLLLTLSIGGIGSLILIAIGSYRWWANK